jgi:hypothetical protein
MLQVVERSSSAQNRLAHEGIPELCSCRQFTWLKASLLWKSSVWNWPVATFPTTQVILLDFCMVRKAACILKPVADALDSQTTEAQPPLVLSLHLKYACVQVRISRQLHKWDQTSSHAFLAEQCELNHCRDKEAHSWYFTICPTYFPPCVHKGSLQSLRLNTAPACFSCSAHRGDHKLSHKKQQAFLMVSYICLLPACITCFITSWWNELMK